MKFIALFAWNDLSTGLDRSGSISSLSVVQYTMAVKIILQAKKAYLKLHEAPARCEALSSGASMCLNPAPIPLADISLI